jgi:hypothetical protein
MINLLVVGMMLAVLGVEYLVRERGLLHPYVVLLPEALSAVAMLIVLARIIAGAPIRADWRYLSFMLLLVFTMILGFVVQDVSTGAMVAGIRAHLKFLPFFLLPLVYRFEARELKVQMMVLMGLLVVQTPLALYQRFFEFANRMDTGDPVKGTATASSSLSMLMICGIAVLVALYLRRKIRLAPALVLMGILFLPTTINETKATLLLLPVALLVPAMLMPRGSHRFRRLLPILAAGGLGGFVFVGVYDALIQYRTYSRPFSAYFEGDQLTRYLYTSNLDEEVNYIGRFDSIEIALEQNGDDPLRLAFGLGAGNVSTSFLPQFDGKYAAYFSRYGVDMTQVTNLLWQVGLFGLSLYLALYYFLLHDSRFLARQEGPDAILGQIWFTVMLVMTFALLYKSIFSMNEIGYLFWYLSGVIAGRAFEHRQGARDRSRCRAPAEDGSLDDWFAPGEPV